MPQPFQRSRTAIQGAFLLLALNLLSVCLPVVAKAQESPTAKPAVFEATASDAAKVKALIAEIVEPEATMELKVRSSKLIRTKVPVTRFAITVPKTVDVVQFTPTEFEIVGVKTGESTLTLWFGDTQSLRYLVTVRPDTEPEKWVKKEYRELEKKINEMFPNSMVQLIPIADKLIVRGQAKDSAEATQILSVLSDQAGYGTGVGVGSYSGVGTLTGRSRAPGRLLGLGRAASPHLGVGEELPAQDVINLLNVAGEQQVMLKVRIAQLDRTAARRMSTQMRMNSGILNLNTDSGLSAAFSSVLTPQDLTLALKAVSTSGYTKLLAEPNLVTLNGQPASFFAGGKFPVPTAVGIGGVSGINTQFQSFGTELTFTPTIIDQDRIRLEVMPSHSTRDEASQDVRGIPSIKSRSVTTKVDLRAGQWLAIAGLLEDDQVGTKTRVPFVGDLPLVGAWFGTSSVARQETELIVLVSPELVHPLDPQEVPLILPGMEVAEPSDAALFLGGAYIAKTDGVQQCSASSPAACAGQSSAVEANHQAVRDVSARPDYQRSEKYYVYGPHGTSE